MLLIFVLIGSHFPSFPYPSYLSDPHSRIIFFLPEVYPLKFPLVEVTIDGKHSF